MSSAENIPPAADDLFTDRRIAIKVIGLGGAGANAVDRLKMENLDRLQSERYSSGRKKHHRRCANDIERRFKCPY